MAISIEDNRGPILNVAMWIILVPTAMMVVAKIYTKWVTAKKVVADDIFMCIAFLFAIAQSIAITEEVKYGLGRREGTVTNRLLVAQYIANVFYVLSIYSAKLSTACFYTCLCASKTSRHIVRWTIVTMVVWPLLSIIVVFFQCSLPHPWDSRGSSCINLKAFWAVNLTFDLVTQLELSFLPIYLLSGLHMSKKANKWFTMLAFTPNLIVIPLAVFRYVFYLHAMSSNDVTWESFNFGLFSSFQAFGAVMFASLPFAKPVLDSLILQPYLIAEEEPESIIPGSKGSSWARIMHNTRASRFHKNSQGSKATKKDSSVHWPYSQTQGETQQDEAHGEQFDLGNYTSLSTKRAMLESSKDISGKEAQDSKEGSTERMVIHQTKTTAVE